MNHKYKSGFTLIELLLSMSFVSVLLVAIALCVIQISTIYNRSETLRQVNQASRTLAVDLRQTLGSANISSIDTSRVVSHGRFCTGQFSYVWNTFNADGTEKYPNNRYSGAGNERFRFIRVRDTGSLYCRSNGGNDLINKTTAQPIELLETSQRTGERSLRVRKLTVSPAAESTLATQKLYVITIMLGTDNVQEINTSNNTCKPPSDLQSNIEYCAVNEFSLTIRAGIR